MALEMRVYDELTEMDAKPVAGMTWRQFFAVVIVGVIGAGVSAWFWYQGWLDQIAYVTAALGIPLALFGWVKPMGLNIETYARHVARSLTLGRLLYENEPTWASHNTPSYRGKRGTNAAPTSRRRTSVIAEAGN